MMTPEYQDPLTTATSSSTTTTTSAAAATTTTTTTTIVTDREGNSTNTTRNEQTHGHQVLATEQACLVESIRRIPHLLNKNDVIHMINLQVTAIDRLESTNRSLVNCNTLAQAKLATTTRLFKKTAKQMCEAKKDLDFVYRRITDLKNKIKTAKSHLPLVETASQKTTKPAEQTVTGENQAKNSQQTIESPIQQHTNTTSSEKVHDSSDNSDMDLKH